MTKKTVLIVDDSVQTVELFKEIILMGGYEPLLAYGGLEALNIVDEHHVDCIILDVMMPGVDGISVCTSLKQGAETKQIPIVIITAFFDEVIKERSYEAGADAFLTKPVDKNVLLKTIVDVTNPT